MMKHKRKQYLYDENVNLSKYAKHKFRKLMKSKDMPITCDAAENDMNTVDNLNYATNDYDENNKITNTILEDTYEDAVDKSLATLVPLLGLPPLSEMHEPYNNSNEYERFTNVADHNIITIPQDFFFSINGELSAAKTIEPSVNLTEYDNGSVLKNNMLIDIFQQSSYIPLTENEVVNGEDFFGSDILEILKENANISSLDELIQKKKFEENVSVSSERKMGEVLLMVIKFALANQLSFTALTTMLRMINCIFETKLLPQSRYDINKLCCPVDNTTFHCICSNCTHYVGQFEFIQNITSCESCGTNINVRNVSGQVFFAILDPSEAIRELIQCYGDYYENVIKHRVHEKNHIKDIYDGKLYRNFVKKLSDVDRYAYATVMFNTDGAPVFESSTVSIWPLYLIVNEIPVQNRLNSAIVVGLWFGKSKPEMNAFLNIFVDVMNKLSTFGIECTVKKEKRWIKIFSLLACVDTPARSPMNGSVQFNGHFGCDWCIHPGNYHGGSMRYPYIIPRPDNRNHASTLINAKEAVRTGTRVFGIKTASPLLNLQCFDIINGFTPDYMHCILRGVAEQITEHLIRYCLSNKDVEVMDKYLINIKVPSQITRLSRPLKDRGYWKAREWENWVLYYSIPLLSTVLRDEHRLKHWAMLTECLHISLKDNITFTELNHVNNTLNRFVALTEELYSINSMTYNIHQLLHITESIFNWGPYWAHSTFPFEAANHKLLLAIQCSRGVIQQIIRFINLQRLEVILERVVYPSCSPVVLQFCKNIDNFQCKKTFQISNIVYFGKAHIVENFYLNKFNLPKNTKSFSKLVINGSLFMTSEKINSRSCHSFAQLKNDKFIKIEKFLVDTENEILVYKLIIVTDNKYSSTVKDIVRISDEVCMTQTNELCRSCVYIQTEAEEYIVPVPNSLFY